MPTILGSSESFARMGSAESDVGPTAAELQVIPTFLMNAPRPLIKWSGNQPCDPSAERDLAHTLPAAFFPQRSRNRFANLEILPARSPFVFKAVLFRYSVS